MSQPDLFTRQPRFASGVELTVADHVRRLSNAAILANPRPTTKDLRRFFSFVRVAPSGCWEWTGYKVGRHRNYPTFGFGQVGVLAHRVSAYWFIGPFDLSLEIDHLCQNPPCVNPVHLEPVTGAVNMQRVAARNVCRAGHQLTPDNTLRNPHRICRTCRLEKRRQWRARQVAMLAAREEP